MLKWSEQYTKQCMEESWVNHYQKGAHKCNTLPYLIIIIMFINKKNAVFSFKILLKTSSEVLLPPLFWKNFAHFCFILKRKLEKLAMGVIFALNVKKKRQIIMFGPIWRIRFTLQVMLTLKSSPLYLLHWCLEHSERPMIQIDTYSR